MSELTEVVAALKTEVAVLEAWAKDQNDALVAAKTAADAKNVELEAARVEVGALRAQISSLTDKLAAATPGSDETVSVVADLKDVLLHLDAITPASVAPVVVPEKPVVDEPVVDDASVSHELADTVDAPVVEAVIEEAGSTSTSAPDAEKDAGHNGET